MERRVTIQDVAQIAGVSKSTVSRYLNKGYISQEKAARIKEAIAQTGFHSNFFARRLKTRESKLLGIIMPRLDSYTGGRLLAGMGTVIEKSPYQALLQVSHLSTEGELACIRSLRYQGVDGILVDSFNITDEHLRLIEELQVPTLFIGQRYEGAHYLKLDDYAAGRILGRHIRELGHKRVVFVGVTEEDHAVGMERKNGFIEVFTRGNRGAFVDFVETSFDFNAAYKAGAEILTHRPTAIVCATDNIALALLRYLHEQAIKVPQEISVVGFGGYDAGAISCPSLTTVSFDYEGLGKMAVRNMIQILQGKMPESTGMLPVKFIPRESTGQVHK